MLPLPEIPARRGQSSPLDPEGFCDWLEASVLLQGEAISQIDIVDCLDERGICGQSEAQVWIADVWTELETREQLCSETYPLSLESQWIRSREDWTRYPTYSFCLLLSLAPHYGWWRRTFGTSYAEQGTLFERLCEEILRELYQSWQPDRVGSGTSSYGNDQLSKEQLIERVCQYVGCSPSDISFLRDLASTAGDLGLDLIWCRPFPDAREGTPYFLIQCASGNNWQTKLQEPNLRRWRRILNSATPPMRGFVVPFWFSDETFIRAAVDIGGLLLDRCRLLSVPCSLSEALSRDIKTWCRPRVDVLVDKAELD